MLTTWNKLNVSQSKENAYKERDEQVQAEETRLFEMVGFDPDEEFEFEACEPEEFVVNEKGLTVRIVEETTWIFRDSKLILEWYVVCRGSQWRLEATISCTYTASDLQALQPK